jgi:hypothetical protein
MPEAFPQGLHYPRRKAWGRENQKTNEALSPTLQYFGLTAAYWTYVPDIGRQKWRGLGLPGHGITSPTIAWRG